MVKIICWNIARKHAAWRFLLGCDADIALLQEAVLPPEDVAERIEVDPAPFHDARGHRVSRSVVVKLSDRVLSGRVKVKWLEPVPIAEASAGDFTISQPGAIAAAIVEEPGGSPVVAASICAAYEKSHPPTGWNIVDASVHRVISDLSLLIGKQNGHRIVAAGDLTIWHGFGKNDYWKRRNDSPWRDNAQLLDIDIGENSLSPTFDSDVFTHTATVANYDESVTLKPALTNSLAYYAIYSETGGAAGDDGVVKLIEGENETRVHVISADRTASSTYTLIVTREGPDPALTLSAEPVLIAEGETATITVAITTKTLFQVDQSIDLAVTGTATSSDYNLLPSLTLPAGAKTATATLTAVSDSEDEEGNETVIVTATHAGQFIGSTTVTIRDEGRDTKDAGGAQALLALSASRWAEEMSDHRKLARRVEGAIGSNHGFVVVDTLKYLAKGGRIGKAQAFLGGMLQFKPIISIRDGEAHPVERPRTRRRAKDRIVEIVRGLAPIHQLHVGYSTGRDNAMAVLDDLADLVEPDRVFESRFGPVLGTHLGPNCVGVAVTQGSVDEV